MGRIATLLALVGTLVAAPEAIAIPGPEELDRLDAPSRAEVMLSLGLDRECEGLLRDALARGEQWPRGPLLCLLLRRARWEEAGKLVDEWGFAGIGGPAPYFVYARTREGQKDWPAAAIAWAEAAAREPLLADYAVYRAGLAHRELGRQEEAMRYFETAGGSARSQHLSARSYWEAAMLASTLGKSGQALENLERIPVVSVIAREDLLGLEARVHRELGNGAREARVLRELMDRAPSSEAAVLAIQRLGELEVPTVDDHLAFAEAALANRHAALAEQQARAALASLGENGDPVRRGHAQLQLGKSFLARRSYTAARRELEQLPEGAAVADRAEAALDRARCLWRLGQLDACLAEFDVVADSDFPEEFRATAGWEAAREASDAQRWEEAAVRMLEFQEKHPDHEYADDALWRRGRALAELGRAEDAVAALHLLGSRYPDSPFREEGAYWSANLLRRVGNVAAACEELAYLRREHADSYWSLRAHATAADDACPPDSLAASAEDRDPFEWLAEALPAVNPEESRRRRDSLRASDTFRRAAVLASVGLGDDAESELATARRMLDGDFGGLLAFAEVSWSIGVPRAAMRAVSSVKAKTDTPILSGATPVRVARLLYPVDHLDAVLRWSAEYDMDPLLVYAVMREESWFDADAVSWAGAQGLLQIMPSTGRDLARRVGLPQFDHADLFRPEINIRLGTFYLHELSTELDREPALVLSAYNAGKKNALRWKNASSSGGFDVDKYVAAITYRETFNYVQKVTRTWEIYRHLYGDFVPQLQAMQSAAGGH
jgi:soluble lytic murein transglycosylase